MLASQTAMLLVNRNNGETLRFDLLDPEELGRWRRLAASIDFNASITGIGLKTDTGSHFIPRPRDFTGVVFSARVEVKNETPVGAQIICATAQVVQSVSVRFDECEQITSHTIRRARATREI